MRGRSMRTGFARASGAGWLGSLSATLGAGSVVQIVGALAGFITLPVLIDAVGSARFGIVVVVVSLAPWLTLIDGSLSPTMRLLVGESRRGDRYTAPPSLIRSGLRLALRIAAFNVGTLVVGLLVLPLVAIFGADGVADRSELVLAILSFSLPIIASGPGGVYLGALEGVGRTVVAVILVGLGPIVGLPLTFLVAANGGGLISLCAVQGMAVALPRVCAWVYWHLRPSLETAQQSARASIRPRLLLQMVALSAAVLVWSGLDPIIVSSQLGAEAVGSFGIANRIVQGALIPLAVLSPLFAGNLAAARGAGWTADSNHALKHLVWQAGAAGLMAGALVCFVGPLVARALSVGQVDAPILLYAAGGAFVFGTFLSAPLYLAFAGPRGLSRSVRLNALLALGNIALSLVLVRYVGASGPLWASALAVLIGSGYWLLMWRRHPEWLGEVHLGEAASRRPQH